MLDHIELDLRHRRRVRTKQAIQREALRLFESQGYSQTTVDDIAHAAAISPRTFFRYFAAKEDAVIWDEYDEVPIVEAFAAGPGVDPVLHLVRLVRAMMADLYEQDAQVLLSRLTLCFREPEVAPRYLDRQLRLVGPFLRGVAEAAGVEPDDLRFAVTLVSVFGAVIIAAERWQRLGGRGDLLDMIDEALHVLPDTATQLRASIAVATASPTASPA